MRKVGIRALKNGPSGYIRAVAAGGTLLVADRDGVVAQIIPARDIIPEEIGFATKIEIARDLIASALDAGARCRFVLADALHGGDSRLRRMPEARRQPYVLAVRSNQTPRMIAKQGFVQTDPKEIAEGLPPSAWKTLAAGEGSKGLRL